MGRLSYSPWADPTAYFNQHRLARTADGTLWAAVTHYQYLRAFYSKDGGSSWVDTGVLIDGVGQNSYPSIFIDADDYLHVVFMQSNFGFAGRSPWNLYYMRFAPNGGRTGWSNVGGSLWVGSQIEWPDLVVHREGSGWRAHVVFSFVSGSDNRVGYRRIDIAAGGTLGDGGGLDLAGYGFGHHTHPTIDFHHTGDGKTVKGDAPHLFVGWNSGGSVRGDTIRWRKATFDSASRFWVWQPERVLQDPANPFQTPYIRGSGYPNHWQTSFWDGTRAVTVIEGRAGNAQDGVHIIDRDLADTTTTWHKPVLYSTATQSPAEGELQVMLGGTATYDSSGNVYLFGADHVSGAAESTRKTHRRRWTRRTSTTGPLQQIGTGTGYPYVTVARGNADGNRIDSLHMGQWATAGSVAEPYYIDSAHQPANRAPAAPTLLAPVGNVALDRAVTQRFSIRVNDPDEGDAMSVLNLRYRTVGSSTWTTLTQQSPNPFLDLPPNTLATASYEWQAQTLDAEGFVSPWSGSEFFSAANLPPAPVFTSPTNNAIVTEPTGASVAWSAPQQDAFQLRVVGDSNGAPNTGAVYSDTGALEQPSTRTWVVNRPVNGRVEHTQVRVRVAGLWSLWGSVRNTVQYVPPAKATVSLAIDARGFVLVAFSHPTPIAPQPAVAYSHVWRRETGSTLARRVGRDLPAGVFTDARVAHRTPYEYEVEAIGVNGSSSFSGWTATAIDNTQPPSTAGAYGSGAYGEGPY